MKKSKNILVTGAAGYIGSHTCVELLENEYSVIAIDNLANGQMEAISRVERITGKSIRFYKGDLRDEEILKSVFLENKIDAVIHFAGYKAVGESVENPLLYYSNNLSATITLLRNMQIQNVRNFVFSSSCTVYGKPNTVPVAEDAALIPTNPYGRSKLMVENLLHDCWNADPTLSATILRYFNPIGAHPSGLIGEDPEGIPNNLLPYISRVAVGRIDKLSVFGGDYDTKDGTGVRDYIHVVDLARAHVAALNEVLKNDHNFEYYNLGTGRGYSVLEVIKAFERASNKNIQYEITNRRPGDVSATYANPEKANKKLGWAANMDLNKMCSDIWNWQVKNPGGYRVLHEN